MRSTTSMTSRERITAILDFKIPDRIGIADEFDDKAICTWKSNGKLTQDVSPQEYFDFDIRLFGFNQDFRMAERKSWLNSKRLRR